MRKVQIHIPRITAEVKALMEENLHGILAVSNIPNIETERAAVAMAKRTVRVAFNEHLSVKCAAEVEVTDTGWNVTVFIVNS